MICFLKGLLVTKHPTKIELDVSGVGYEVIIPLSTYDQLPAKGKEVKILTHNLIREDAHILYGFINEEEKELFKLVIKINRVGPKVALSILSKMSAKDFKHAVMSEDTASISGISGVGKKTAERIIMELKEKLPKMTFSRKKGEKSIESESEAEKILGDAVSGLESLGYKRNAAFKACVEILNKKNCSVEELIRMALRRMS